MAEKGSVFQKGGGGTNFEQLIQTAFLTTLIVKGNAPSCFSPNEIIEVAFQTTNRGYDTDDLLVIAKSTFSEHKLLIQIKHNISFTTKDKIFKEVIESFWKDFKKTDIFDKKKDRLLIIKSGFTQDERNHLKSLLNWAKTHGSELDFFTEVKRIKGKENYLQVFRDCLKEANNGIALTDPEIWEFLICFDVLEYDFANEGSVDKANFLNLIKLCKNINSTANEKEIWDILFAYVSRINPNGGSVRSDNIPEELSLYFDLSKLNIYHSSIEKLKSDSNLILSDLKNNIGGLHINRVNVNQPILESLNKFQFTVVIGKPGVGKSSKIKEILENEFSNASVIVFKADQFNKPTISNVFSNLSINEPVRDIFSYISIIPDKIIFIDSLEKLLEADPECAFSQLLGLIKEFPDIKIVGSSRKYALDLIIQKFGINKNELSIVEVPPFDEIELALVSDRFSQLKNVLKNQKLKILLQSPKYLDFAIKALNNTNVDFNNISISEFKDKLWDSLVVNSTVRRNGMPIKREKAFMEIAVNRAKEMKLFIEPINSDEEAIILLENDEILIQEKQNRKYSPSHDILEDWALVKFVSKKYEESPKPNEFFCSLGNSPAIRRAFRLWVENSLIDDNFRIIQLIRTSISDNLIERFWADELLIAVFKSENYNNFFISFEKELIQNDAQFLNRCLHLLRTACKESDLKTNSSILFPIGSGWTEVILFIRKNILLLDSNRLTICNFLSDWEYRLMFQNIYSETELYATKDIILHYVHQIEKNDAFWIERNLTSKKNTVISIFFNLAKICKNEITELFEHASDERIEKESWDLNSFYKNVIDKGLSGAGNHTLVNTLPDLIVQTAWKEWKLEKKESINDGSLSSIFASNELDVEECWGINKSLSWFPPGIYKTPMYDLLWADTYIGLKFITEFINYSIDFYVNADCEFKHEFKKIEVQLNNEIVINQWASPELWSTYRGLSVTHYLIESLLMSLEKYLFEICLLRTELSRENLKIIFNYLLEKSNNVSIAGVLTSVSIAYPEEVGDAMLPLLTVKEFFEYDLNRSIKENSSLAMHDNSISFAQEERIKSNQLSHRKKHRRGLSDFILWYQLKIGKINKEIHIVFDMLKLKFNDDDKIWKKVLTEIDIRNLAIGEYDEKQGGFPLIPKYEKDTVEFIDSNKIDFESEAKSTSYSTTVVNVYEKKEEILIEKWRDIYSLYSNSNNFDFLFDRPISLAVLGLRDFSNLLSSEEKTWCEKTLAGSILKILKDSYNHNFELNVGYNFMEKDTALSSFHYLLNSFESTDEKNKIMYLIFKMILGPFQSHELEKIIKYVRTELFEHCPTQTKKIWVSLIKYAKFKNENIGFQYSPDPAKVNQANQNEDSFIWDLISSNDLELNLNELSLKTHQAHLLVKAFLIIPFDSKEEIFTKFIKFFIPLVTEDLKIDDSYSNFPRNEKRQVHDTLILEIEFYLAELLLKSYFEFTKEILDLILDPTYAMEFTNSGYKKNLFEFSSKVPEHLLYKLDDILANSKDEDFNNHIISKFWKIWGYFFEKVKTSGKQYFVPTLLFDVKWKIESEHWKVLENKKDFYHKLVLELGKNNSKSILNVISTIGEKTFLPDGLNWLVEIYNNNNKEIDSLNSLDAERLVKRLFYNYISTIKKDKVLVDNFIWILNKMIDLGSSEAYLFRENVITYKTNS